MRPVPARWTPLAFFLLPLLLSPPVAAQDSPPTLHPDDPRVGLGTGLLTAGVAMDGMVLLSHRFKPAGLFNPENLGDFSFANSDIAFQGDLLFLGGYQGYQVWDVSDPANPALRTSFVCPGGQGDPSIYGTLLFISVEETRGRVDCGTQGVQDTVSAERFRGVRIFDISNLDNPIQVAAVQTCRGSHTHTLVPDPSDDRVLYVYVSGTSIVRSPSELEGCSSLPPEEDPNTSYFRIEVIRVPLDNPAAARVVSTPRLFADAGRIGGLWRGGDHGPGTQETSETDQCHDITVYPAMGVAAGACSGNGILIDISDPANPTRIAEVSDPNFAYWHSATFNNDATTVLFTDEWGGGGAARCLATDRPQWGADAIYTRDGNTLTPASFYKLPAPQTEAENCVAHNGSLIPVPGRDIMVQGWYQGGISVLDFTDPAHPVEIAYFDRGPITDELVLGGHWSVYWYNGHIYGSEIVRGLDVLKLVPTEHLTQNEIDAAASVRYERFNPQMQPRIEWPATFAVARAYLDQLARNGGLPAGRITEVAAALDRAEGQEPAARAQGLADLAMQLERDAGRAGDAGRVRALAGVLRAMGTP